MFKRFQGFVIGCLVCMLITGVVFAKTGSETIQALYNNIKIYVDGVKIETKDVNGNNVEPFIYNGTTYLPVRAVGEAIGKTVTWDGSTQSVYLGEKPGDKQYLMEVCPPYTYKYCDLFTVENGKSFLMGGNKYTNGFIISKDQQTGFRYFGEIQFNLNGKYKKMTLDLGSLDEQDTFKTSENTTVQFYLDNSLIKEVELIMGDIPKSIEIDLNYGMQLKILHTNFGVIGAGNVIVK